MNYVKKIDRSAIEIAVIGLAGRFPGARNISQYWDNLKNGVESITFYSDQELENLGVDRSLLDNQNYVKAGGSVQDTEYFDASFFSYLPSEAEIMDPQMRFFHECSWEALEDAGYDPGTYDGLIGLYAGASPSPQWEALSLLSGRTAQVGNFASTSLVNKEYLTTKISYKLNLRGPSSFIHTACSTSLVAIHWACRAIVSGECQLALAGGVNIVEFPPRGYMYEKDMVLSRDGRCRAFDAKADGTVPGSGIGIVVLKRLKNALQDRDHIYAVIKGTAINNDGGRKVGYTAPSVEGQAEVIRTAMAMARVEADSIGYVETHGTATAMGDPVEIEALKLAFQGNGKKICGLGSVKTNIGHLDVAAGAAGFIKAVLAVKNQFLPPSLHFESPNPEIDFEKGPFYVVDRPTPWKRNGHPLRAGVSSFGIGGTNAHIILEEPPVLKNKVKYSGNGGYHIIPLSAKSPSALDRMSRNLSDYLTGHPGLNLADMAYTLQIGRQAFQHRRVAICNDVGDVAETFSGNGGEKYRTAFSKEGRRSPIFMFAGLGSQYVNMGSDLYQNEPEFRRQMDRCFDIVKSIDGRDLKKILYPGREEPAAAELTDFNHTEIAQLVVFVMEYSLAQLVISYGIKPHAMIGYSLGEYTAACLSGVFSLEDALKLISTRGRLVAKLPTGTMLSAPLPADELRPFLNREISIAIDNGPSCIVAGPDRYLDELRDKLKGKRCLCMQLPNSHAIHSGMMKPILKEFEVFMRTITLNKPQIPYVSNVTAQWVTVEDATDPVYWCRHLSRTVRFAEGIELLKKEPNPIFIEIGPGRDLSTILVRHQEKDPEVKSINFIRPSQQDVRDHYYFLSKMGQLWLYGATVDWKSFHAGDERSRIPLPTYPFDRHRYWFEGNPFKAVAEILSGGPMDQREFQIKFVNTRANKTLDGARDARMELSTAFVPASDETEKILVKIWEEFFGIEPLGIEDDFFELGGDSLKAQTLMSIVHTALDVRVPLAELFEAPTIKGLAAFINGAEKESYTFMETIEEQDSYELSYAQRRLWVLSQFEENSTAYNMPAAAVISGDFDREAFRKTVQSMVECHESLRTVFVSVAGEPRQKILGDFAFDLEVIDHRHLDEDEKQEKTRQSYYDIANWVFDLAKGPLFRLVMIRLEEGKFLLVMNIHHIITDGWSETIFYREFVTLYNGFCQGKKIALPALEYQYKDYSYWHNQMIVDGRFDRFGSYWLDKFKDKPTGIELPTDHPRQPVQTFNGGRISFTISKEEGAQLYAISQKEGATYFMNMLSLLNIFLYKYTGQDDVIVGAPIANRKHPELHNMIGFFVNTLVYRNKIEPVQSFKEVLANIKKEALTCYEYQDFPFDLLMEQLEPDRDLSWSPLFNVMMVPHTAIEENRSLVMDGLNITAYAHSGDANISKFDLTFFMDEKEGNEIQVAIEYNSDLFERSTIERMAANFRTLSKQVIQDPESPVSSLEILAAEELETVTRQFNDTAYDYADHTLQEMFENQVEINPDKKAVVGDDQTSITYSQLNARANQIAHYLREDSRYGVKRNDVIGISMERSIDMIAVILGVLKSGAAYLAIDPSYPKDRVLHILADSAMKILIIDKMRPELFGDYDAEILEINTQGGDIQKQPAGNLPAINTPSDILYVNYTSGSTGTPNGAKLSHDCLTNLIRWQKQHSGVDCSLNTLQFTSINFCVSFQEIMGTLTSGGELHLIGEYERQDISYLMDFLGNRRIGTLFLPFSYLNFLFNESNRWNKEFKHQLKHIITAGEQLKITSGLKRFLEANPGLKLHNHYGSTEMHVVTSYTLDASTVDLNPIPPAGKPVKNVNIYILDENLNPVPVGVWGELFVKGSSEVLGYINNQQLNAKKLIHHPRFSSSGNIKLYRSGDIGRWMPDGNIELRGRKDFMVKVNGFRVEPGEIESKILAIQQVRECVVVVREDASKQKYLVAYLSETGIDSNQIRQILVSTLPQYMIPKIVVVDSLPLMPNGKVDREKLPDPRLGEERLSERVAPTNNTEKKLAAIWSQLIERNIGHIGIDDNFFELGGHSLKAIKMMAQIHKEFEVKIELGEIFQTPTIREIAGFLRNREKETFKVIHRAPEMEYYPVSSAQKRLYILQQMIDDFTGYNMPEILALTGLPDKERLTRAFRQLIRRHESLRTSFFVQKGEPVQKIHRHADFDIQFLEAREHQVEELVQEFISPFDLTEAPLLRVSLVRLEEERHILMLDLHHIISDGTSMGVMIEDFADLYSGKELGDVKLQYKDFSQWQNSEKGTEALMKQREFWNKELAGQLPVIELPLDYKRPAVQSFDGRGIQFDFDGPSTDALKALALSAKTTLYSVLLALYNIFLARITGQDDIIVGTPVAGRTHADLEKVMGMFVNTLALRNFPSDDKTVNEFLGEVRDKTISTFENQDYQFEDIVDEVVEKRDTSRNPIFDVMFVLQNMFDPSGNVGQMDIGGLSMKRHPYVYKISKFDLNLVAIEVDSRLTFKLEYCTHLFKEDTIQRFARYFETIKHQVLKNPDIKISDIELTSPAERTNLLHTLNRTEVQYTVPKTLDQLFEEQVEKTPDNMAVAGQWSSENDTVLQITYRELNRKANLLAHHLQEKGVGPDTIVALMMERSIEMMSGIFGILKAGGAYLPIDLEYPEERIKYMLNDSGAIIMVTDQKTGWMDDADIDVLRITEAIDRDSSPTPVQKARPGNLCYIIYTSGSTGQPKGVLTIHSNVPRVVRESNYIDISERDKVLQLSNYAFDGSVFDIYGALLNGALLVMTDRQKVSEAGKLAIWIKQWQVSVFFVTTALFNVLVDLKLDFLKDVRYVLFGGERVSVEHSRKALEYMGPGRIKHVYGPTETTVYASCYDIDDLAGNAATIPIGSPLANTGIYILDKNLSPTPTGINGEVYVGGEGVARGYLNRPELTAEKFLAHPFKPGKLLYRTGDLARWLPEGNVEFIGRIDHQVKIRGFRIELGEIENRLLQHPDIEEVVVMTKQISADNQDKHQICAYLVSATTFTVPELKSYLGEHLPDYMIPARFAQVEKFPLNPNGKIDRKALSVLSKDVSTGIEYTAPQSEVEEQIAGVWQEILGLEKVGVHDNFFDLGGTSLDVIKLNEKFKDIFPDNEYVVKIFRHPTIRSFAQFLTGKDENTAADNNIDRSVQLDKVKNMRQTQKNKRKNRRS